jgi:carbon-monoxide dehydrogenase medium subunit
VSFEYHAPTSMAEAIGLAARHGEDARFLAGGTDLIIQMRRGRLAPRHVVSLRRVPGLDTIAVNGRVTLGAAVTHRALERSPHFHGALRALVEGAEVIGGHQVRNVGTVGGNIVNASPAADLVPVLLALDASVTCAGAAGERTLPLADFLLGPGRTARRPDELLTAVHFEAPAPRTATAFLKAGRRRAMEISVACVAVRLALDADGRCAAAAIALGAVAPTAVRAPAAGAALGGRALDPAALRDAGREAAAACAPIDDVRASARYRRLLVETLVPRAIARCLARIEARA